MKKRTFLFLAAAGLLASCDKGGDKQLDATAVQQQIDSLVGTRLGDITLRANEDLDRRMSIEVKVKADSIVAARTLSDTTARRP